MSRHVIVVAAMCVALANAFVAGPRVQLVRQIHGLPQRIVEHRSAPASNVSILSCPNDAGCQGSSCETYTYPNGACLQGGSYTCMSSLATCMTGTNYYAALNATACSTAAPTDNAGVVCGFCYSSAYSEPGQFMYGKLINCQDNTKRELQYECDATCTTCAKTMKAPLNTCLKNPFSGGFTNFDGTRSCQKVVRFSLYANQDCTGGVKQANVIPANVCSTYNQPSIQQPQSTEFMC